MALRFAQGGLIAQVTTTTVSVERPALTSSAVSTDFMAWIARVFGGLGTYAQCQRLASQ